MCQAEQIGTALCHEGMYGFIRIEEPAPGRERDLLGERRLAAATIKGVVAFPTAGATARNRPR